MTSAGAVLLEARAQPRRALARRRLVEFLLVGGITLPLFPLAWLLQYGLGLDSAELAVGFVFFHAAFLINDPHFSVTYLLFYRNVRQRAFGRELGRLQRARYLMAGFVLPLILAAWATAALVAASAEILGALIQAMFFLVGWHYVKQGFGVFAVLSARRGVRFSAWERAAVLAHCFAGWAYAWASPADPGRPVSEKGVVYTTFAHPPGLETLTGLVFGLSVLPLVWVMVKKARREAGLPPLAPLAGLLITVWLWTVYSSLNPLMVYAIPALHSLQYLYFVWLLRRNEAREAEGPPNFGKPVAWRLGTLAATAVGLGWLLLAGVPSFFDELYRAHNAKAEATDLGPTPYLAAFFAFVNIHHYFMDHVIWRRENPETRFLRSER